MERKILVTDDDPLILRMAEMFLAKAGYAVLKAQSGQACLEILEREKVDLVLLDVEMPELNGIETLKTIRSSHLAENIPVYFLSGSQETEEKMGRGEYPADGFLKKPFLPAVLLDTVRQALQ